MTKPLRVIELPGNVAVSYAAKLLGDHGADVIKLEPPGGDPLRATPGYFSALNVNKRSVVLDEDAAATHGLIADADILLHSYNRRELEARGLTAQAVTARWPRLVTLALTPFGLTGPHADYSANELIVANSGGWANLCPSTHTDPALPPLKVAGEHCHLMAAVAAVTAALASVRSAGRTGLGEYIDFSLQSYVASVLEAALPIYTYRGMNVGRYHPRSLIPWRILQARDGGVFIACIEDDQWRRLVEFLDNPDWATLDLLDTAPGRAENQDLIHAMLQEVVSQWDVMEFFHAAQAHRVCVAPVFTFAQLATNEHLREREFFVRVGAEEHLASAILGINGRPPVRCAAPATGEHTQEVLASAVEPPVEPNTAVNVSATPTAPLAGVRVLDLTWAWAGPFCSLNLAHLGAEVIRLESDTRADLYRRMPIFEDDVPGLNKSGMFNQWNQGKYSIGINLNQPEAIALIKELAVESDVVVQNFATGVMDRLGLGYEVLKSINPRIILASISGFGQSGPYLNYMGYGPAIAPLTGLAEATGYVGGEAEEFGISMPDPTAGITAAMAVVSALLKCDETGVGDHLDISLWEATAVLGMEHWMQYQTDGKPPVRNGNRHPRFAPHGVFPCAPERDVVPEGEVEDRWIAIAVTSDEAWQALAGVMGKDIAMDARFSTAADRKANEDELEALISDWTRGRNRHELAATLQALGVMAFPTYSCADVVHDEHLNARGFIERLPHPEVGRKAHTGIPWLLHHRGNGVARPAPCLGADTDRYLRELLGKTDAEIAELKAAGVIISTGE